MKAMTSSSPEPSFRFVKTKGHVVSPSTAIACGVSPTADAAFIAHARADVPDLVAEVRRLQARIDDFETHVLELGEMEGL